MNHRLADLGRLIADIPGKKQPSKTDFNPLQDHLR